MWYAYPFSWHLAISSYEQHGAEGMGGLDGGGECSLSPCRSMARWSRPSTTTTSTTRPMLLRMWYAMPDAAKNGDQMAHSHKDRGGYADQMDGH